MRNSDIRLSGHWKFRSLVGLESSPKPKTYVLALLSVQTLTNSYTHRVRTRKERKKREYEINPFPDSHQKGAQTVKAIVLLIVVVPSPSVTLQ
jgi:hypothetical protein